jgi:hypothetical protein
MVDITLRFYTRSILETWFLCTSEEYFNGYLIKTILWIVLRIMWSNNEEQIFDINTKMRSI